jgi:hypothetical protein
MLQRRNGESSGHAGDRLLVFMQQEMAELQLNYF